MIWLGCKPSTHGAEFAGFETQPTGWRNRAGTDDRPRIGIVWRGNPGHSNDVSRSLSLKDCVPLFEVPGVQFISLQKEMSSEDRMYLQTLDNVADLGTAFEDFADTAAVVVSLDLVIAVDTSVAHLAGAMNKPVWTLVSALPDFRWLLDREDSPWYPSATLFRQRRRGRWPPVIEEVVSRLMKKVEKTYLPRQSTR